MNTYGGFAIEESVLLPPGWVMATQNDGLNTYVGPLKDMPRNQKFSKLKLPSALYAEITAPPPRLPLPSPAPARSGIELLSEYRFRV